LESRGSLKNWKDFGKHKGWESQEDFGSLKGWESREAWKPRKTFEVRKVWKPGRFGRSEDEDFRIKI